MIKVRMLWRGVLNEKMYLLHGNGYIAAVKRGDKFLNLVSMTDVLFDSEGKLIREQASAHTNFVGKPQFSL